MQNGGLECLVMLAKYHGFHADPAQINHAFAIQGNLESNDMLRIARELGLKAKASKISYETLTKLSFPLILKTTENNYVVGAKKDIAQNNFLILDPR